MEMAFYFLSLFNALNEFEKRNILRNIFFINDVSEYSVFIENDNVYFNFYFNSVYYRYVFYLKNVKEVKGEYVTFFHEDRIYYYSILPYLYPWYSGIKYPFDILSRFFLSLSKKEANDLFRQLL